MGSEARGPQTHKDNGKGMDRTSAQAGPSREFGCRRLEGDPASTSEVQEEQRVSVWDYLVVHGAGNVIKKVDNLSAFHCFSVKCPAGDRGSYLP